MLLVADTLAPPASLLRLAASIVVERAEDSATCVAPQRTQSPPHVQQLVAAVVDSARERA
jgi:hypothetical protein